MPGRQPAPVFTKPFVRGDPVKRAAFAGTRRGVSVLYDRITIMVGFLDGTARGMVIIGAGAL